MKQLLFISAVIFAACTPSNKISTVNAGPNGNYTTNGKVFTSLFQQQSAEYRALCHQAYNVAAMQIDRYVPTTNKPKALITDIDETILDNSPYAVHQGLQGKEYELPSWYDWTSRAMADTMAGAAKLLRYAQSKGIEIFYVTNRDGVERAATLKNLQKFNLPNADDRHLILREGTSSKEVRRQKVAETHEIVLLMGDNLGDFSHLFDKKTPEERKNNTDISASNFGTRFIVFPNPNYGDWEGALFNYNYKLTNQQKDSVLRAVLKNY